MATVVHDVIPPHVTLRYQTASAKQTTEKEKLDWPWFSLLLLLLKVISCWLKSDLTAGREDVHPRVARASSRGSKRSLDTSFSLPLSLLYPPVFVFVSQLFLVSESACVLQLVRTFAIIPSSYLSQLGLWKPTCREAIEIFCPRQPRQSEWKLLNRSGFEEEETFVVWNVVVHGNDLWLVCMVLNVWV